MRYVRPNDATTYALTGAPAGLAGTLTFELVAVTPGASGAAASNSGVRQTWTDGTTSDYAVDRALPGPVVNVIDGDVFQPKWHNGATTIDDPDLVTLNSSGVPPEVSSQTIPSLAELRAASPLIAERLPQSTPNDATLTMYRDSADASVMLMTGRSIGGVTGPGAFGCPLEVLPDVYRPLLVQVVARFVERVLVTTGVDLTEDSITAAHGGLASFSAGPYSESYFNPGQIVERRTLDEDPAISGILWALATDCARAGWERLWHPELAGLFAPARSEEVTDWFPESRSTSWPFSSLSRDYWPGAGDPDVGGLY